MSLSHIHEPPRVRRRGDGVIESGIGETPVAPPVQPDPVELQLHVIVAAPGQVKQGLAGFIDPHDAIHLERMTRQCREQLAGQVIQVIVAEPGPSLRYCISGAFSTQPVGHSSRTMVRHFVVTGEQAVNSMMFWRRLVRLTVSSLESGVQPT